MGFQPHTAFIQTLCERGILPQEFRDSVTAGATVTLTEPAPLEQGLSPVYLRINTVEELKELGGVPDEEFGTREDRNPMPALSAKELAGKRTLHRDYCLAMKKYVYGNSKEVAEYAACINEKRLPMNIPMFTGGRLVVPPGQRFTFPASLGPHIALSYESIEMGDKSSLVFETNVSLFANSFTAGTDITLSNDGERGGNGGNGGNGSGGGGGGSIGGNGGNGGDGNTFNYDIGQLLEGAERSVTITSRGGSGGTGGTGGKGGKGNYDKNGGPGGAGGNGGKGGNGGDGTVEIREGRPTIFNTNVSGGAGGAAGSGGAGGDAGGGTSGNRGAQGSDGNPGAGGNGGKIAIIQ